VRQWLAGLADADPAVRETSRLGLMRLKADELPILHDEVVALGTVDPGQAQALPDIVRHVHLKGTDYDKVPSGFLGLSWPASLPPLDQTGVVVEGRLPGFDVYGVLETGDVILAIGNPGAPVRTHQDLTEPIRMLPPGTELAMTIRRGVEEMQVEVMLGSRPRVADDPTETEKWQADRLKDADTYWDQEFAPLVDPAVPVAGR
jgi:hypothetical protein